MTVAMYRCVLSAICLGLVLGSSAAWAIQPNILLILADDLGYGEVNQDPSWGFPVDPLAPDGGHPLDRSAFPSKAILRTPNLVTFAKQGIRATMSYAGSALCSPSRASIMLGRQIGSSDVRGNEHPELVDNSTFVFGMLQAGYETAYVGKWGLGQLEGGPWNHGFQYYWGQLDNQEAHSVFPPWVTSYNSSKNRPPQKKGEALKLRVQIKANHRRITEKTCPLSRKPKCIYVNDLARQQVFKYMADRSNSMKPFYLVWAPTYPHFAKYDYRDPYSKMGFAVKRFSRPNNLPSMYRSHASQIEAHLDGDIGKLLKFLEQNPKLDEKTLLVFTSDNGAQQDLSKYDASYFGSTGGLRGTKKSGYDGGFKVPTILRWKGHLNPGTVSRVPFMLFDLAHTFRDLAENPIVESPGGRPGLGASMRKHWMTGNEDFAPQRTWLYAEFCNWNDLDVPFGCQSGLYNISNWKKQVIKLVVTPNTTELYNIATDPTEQIPLNDNVTLQNMLVYRQSIRVPVPEENSSGP